MNYEWRDALHTHHYNLKKKKKKPTQYCSSIKAKLLPKCRCLLSAKIQYFLRPKFHKRVKPKHLGSNFIDLWVENEARKCRSYIPAMATRITSIVCLGRKLVHKMTRIPQIWKCHYLQQRRVSSHKILPFRLVNFSILVNVGFKKRLSNFGVNKHENTGEQTPFGEQSKSEKHVWQNLNMLLDVPYPVLSQWSH